MNADICTPVTFGQAFLSHQIIRIVLYPGTKYEVYELSSFCHDHISLTYDGLIDVVH